jgi:hypothetical protein
MAVRSFVEEAAPLCFAAAWVCLLGSKLSPLPHPLANGQSFDGVGVEKPVVF